MKKEINIKNLAILFAVFAAGVVVGGYYFKSVGMTPPEGVSFTPFFETWAQIKNKFYGYSKDTEEKMLEGAIRGTIESLKDPYSSFLDKNEYSQFQEELSGEYEGIGAEIGIREEKLTIISPLKGTAAEKAGLLAGDRILEIDGEKTDKMGLVIAVMKIRGKSGTVVNLKIQRGEKVFDVKITRQRIEIPVLDYKMLGGNIGYIRIYNFYENTFLKFKKAAEEILKSGSNKIILDLRNNPGGFLDSAVNIGGFFIQKDKIVVKQDFGKNKVEDIKSDGPGGFENFKIIILVNEGSASASEILAGAIKEHNKEAKIVGKKTFGKGSVQEMITLNNKSAIKITIAHWLLPSGKYIEGEGILPDIEVDLIEDDFNKGKDPQLDKAKELLK